MMGGFFGKMARSLMGDTMKKRAPEAPVAPEGSPGPSGPAGPAPTHGVVKEEPPVSPVRPQTGAPPTEVDAFDLDESIYDVGRFGEFTAEEQDMLQGRMSPRRNINLNFFKDTGTKHTIEWFNKVHGGGQDLPARQRVTHDETLKKTIKWSESEEELRERMGRIINSKISDKWEPSDLVSIYQLMETQGQEVRLFAQELKAAKAAGADVSTEDLAHYQLLTTRFVATQEIAATRAAEAGRMLNALQAVAKSGGKQYYKDLDNIIRGAGGPDTVWASIDRVADAKTLKEVAKGARDGFGTRAYKTLVQLRYNMMLSSVRTHVANIGGSTMAGMHEAFIVNPTRIALNNAEYLARSLVQKTFGKGGMRAEDRMHLSEIVDYPTALVSNVWKSLKFAKKVFKGEELGHGKIYNELGLQDPDASQGGGLLGGPFTAPTRALEAEDAFFKSVYSQARIDVMARRQALLEAKDDADFEKLFTHYKENPTDAMQERALAEAEKMTFTNDPSAYGKLIGSIAKAMGELQQGSAIGRLILPFVRTPADLMGYTIEQTPLNALVAPRRLLAQLKDPATRHDAEARIAIAAGLYAMLKPLWEAGYITGAEPTSWGVRVGREASGWRPNAAYIDNEYYELNRMDPMGLILGAYATLYDSTAHSTEEDTLTAMAATFIGTADLLVDRSMLSGLGDVIDAFDSSNSSGAERLGKLAGRMATSFIVPGVMRDVREMTDPYQRRHAAVGTLGGTLWETIKDTVQNATPGLSGNSPPRVDAHGRDMLNPAGWLWRGIIPVRVSAADTDPVSLAYLATGVSVAPPDHEISILGGPTINLREWDGGRGWLYNAYERAVGRERHKQVSAVLRSAAWKKAVDTGNYGPDSPIAEVIGEAVREGRKIATLNFFKDMIGRDKIFPTIGGKRVGKAIELTHTLDQERYNQITRAVHREGHTQANRDMLKMLGLDSKYTPEQKGRHKDFRIGPDFKQR